MELTKESVIDIQMKLSADDALRAYLVLGRTNGSSKGFSQSLYCVLAEALGIESLQVREKLQEFARDMQVVNYYGIQRQVEKLFFADNAKRNELTEKQSELKKLQLEVDNLKRELGELS